MSRPADSLAPAPVVRLATVGSTQGVAFALAEGGAPDRTVVIADVQTAGRGRQGRPWRAEPGTSLLASILLRPRLDVGRLPTLSLTTAVAVAETLEAAVGLRARLKWPNDVLVRGRKIAGILLESRLAEATVVVAGIGINVRQRRFPPDLEHRATSIALETGRDVAPQSLLGPLLDRLDAWRARLERDGFGPVRESWLARSEIIGRAVMVGGEAGIAMDLDHDGALLVRRRQGIARVIAGEVEPAPGWGIVGTVD